MQAQGKKPLFLQKEKSRFAGTEEGAPVPVKGEKQVCRDGGSRPCSYKRRKAGLQAQGKEPLFLQKEKSRFAGTGEEATVPTKGEK
ncbi:hypothetical protein QA612_04025 [Evansella sp. AB-P1]|uniref:hypothetical protein n=1 Tax=Evansella sp. AB-P1 TaxID=3037653 RepID=UPI00241CA5BE|nr:hypothetical protein [Evansella sp. AB-P1]MDG5786647.1 hypothetical protein [Evansella sp. AB-P1]